MFNSTRGRGTCAQAYKFFRLRTLSIVIAATFGLAGCWGGGSYDGDEADVAYGGAAGDPNATDTIPTMTSLASLNTLTTDANQHYRLFYVDASNSRQQGVNTIADPWLMAYDPQVNTSEVIDDKYEGLGSMHNVVSPLALHKADIDSANGEINNYQVVSVSYFRSRDFDLGDGTVMTFPGALMRVGVGAGNTPEQVTDEAGAAADLGFNTVRQMVAFNLKNANKAEYVFPAKGSTQAIKKYRHVDLSSNAITLVNDFAAGLNVQTPLFETQGATAGSAYGWLVADQNKSNCLARVLKSDLANTTCIPNADGSGNVVLDQSEEELSYIAGVYPLNNGVVLALPKENPSNSLQVTTTLWFYERNTNKLHLLKNSAGETLETTGLPMFGSSEAGRVVSKNGDTLYLATDDGGIGGIFGGSGPADPSKMEFHTFVHKITTSSGNIGWEQVYHKGGKLLEGKAAILGGFLIDAGTHLILEVSERLIAITLDGQHEVLLDGRSSSGSSLIRGAFLTPLSVVSQGGWFFYNREANHADYATAIKKDGSKRVELKNCMWIGASTNGKAGYVGGSFSSLEPSEVFMACNNKQISAVDANDPEAGRVILGSLAEPAKSIEMGRAAPGPNRLMRVVYNNKRYEVVYVDTRAKNSLKHLMASPADEAVVDNLAGLTGPVDGF